MSAITDRRRELRQEARERQKETIPKLRALVRDRKAARRKRLAKCRADCKRMRGKVQRDALRARELLRARIKKAKLVARDACGLCKVSATDRGLDELDRAFGKVQAEREAIAELRRRAAQLTDPRGRAGGRRSAEVRAESDDEVRRNVADDPDLAALWDSTNKLQFKRTRHRSRTEAFLEHVHDNPEDLDELRAKQDAQYDREAEELFAKWPRDETVGKMTDAQLAEVMADLDRADVLAEDAAPF